MVENLPWVALLMRQVGVGTEVPAVAERKIPIKRYYKIIYA
jgi:hypothetical protein